MNRLQKIEFILIISFASLLVFPVLFVVRFLDANTLTSWKWVFHNAGIGKIMLFILFGLLVSFFLSRISVHENYFVPLLMILSFAIVLPLWSEPEMIVDASRYFVQAKSLKLSGIGHFIKEWGGEIQAWTDLPLVPFLYGHIFKYIGEARVYIQFFTTILFALSAVITFLIGKELWDEETGFYAGILLMAIPYLTVQVPLMMVDVPALFIITLSMYLYIKAVRNGGLVFILLSSFVIVLSLLSKYSVWLMLFILPVISYVYRNRSIKETLLRSGLVIGIAGLVCAIIVLAKSDVFSEQVHILGTYQLPALSKWKEGFISTFFFQSHPFLIILACYSAYRAIKKRDVRFLVPFWFALFVLIFQAKRIRYIVPLFPLFALMASYGLKGIRYKDVQRFLVLSILGTSLVFLFTGFLPFLKRTGMANLQHAGEYIDTLSHSTFKVYTLPQQTSSGNTDVSVPLLDLYTEKALIFEPGTPQLPERRGIRETSLRFTWEFVPPEFYSDNQILDKTLPAVIISGEKADEPNSKVLLPDLLSHYTLKRGFELATGAFRFKTFVYLMEREPLSNSGQ